MQRNDLWWVLAYPVYQLIGTFRHEASHALAALVQGARITEFVIWPTQHGWGYVRWEGSTTIAVTAAPYLCDAVTFLVLFTVCMVVHLKDRRWIWLNAVAIGIISPLANSAYNYYGGLRGWMNDVGKMLNEIRPGWVHGYFLVTLGIYLTGLVLVFTTSRTARS